MQLVFHDATSVSSATTAGDPMLTVERNGNFSLSIGAVAALKLLPKEQVILVQDAETNSWYLVLDSVAGKKPFVLKPRDSKNSRALMFCASQRARAYYEAHGLRDERSVRALIGLEPVKHEGLALFPLVPQHSTKTPVVAEPATPVADAPIATAPEVEQPVLADVMPAAAPSFLEPEQSGTPPMLTTSSVPALAPGALPESRGEQLADYWNEREISDAKPDELEEILKVIGGMARSDRGFTENKVLNQAKTEAAKRLKAADKKGGARG